MTHQINLILQTMYIYYVYPEMSKSPRQLQNCTEKKSSNVVSMFSNKLRSGQL
jgi:hypothetical protein